jgi:hypothetical protein
MLEIFECSYSYNLLFIYSISELYTITIIIYILQPNPVLGIRPVARLEYQDIHIRTISSSRQTYYRYPSIQGGKSPKGKTGFNSSMKRIFHRTYWLAFHLKYSHNSMIYITRMQYLLCFRGRLMFPRIDK